jgi:hypothetical protein
MQQKKCSKRCHKHKYSKLVLLVLFRNKENVNPATGAAVGEVLFHKLKCCPPWPVRVTGLSDQG